MTASAYIRCPECRDEFIAFHTCPAAGDRTVSRSEALSYGKHSALAPLDPAARRARHDLVMQRERERLERV